MEPNQAIPPVQTIIDECLPLLKALAKGRCAVTLGGSRGKRTADNQSDLDFRVFCDEIVGGANYWENEAWKPFAKRVEYWRAQGVHIDYCWVRTVSEIDMQLDAWLSGQIAPVDQVWTLWGYHLLTDIANQVVIEDPAGLIAGWQARLTPYPPPLQNAILKKHLGSLHYWRTDYHYRNKVERGDVVFLAGMAARLVHDILQVLFAINQAYYVGDGNNLHYVAKFPIKPDGFAKRVQAILYPAQVENVPPIENVLVSQYEAILKLIDEVMALAADVQSDP